MVVPMVVSVLEKVHFFFALQSLFCIQGVFVILPLSVDLGISSAWDEALQANARLCWRRVNCIIRLQ